MFCVSTQYRHGGVCIYLNENDKWADFQQKIENASGIPAVEQRIYVGNKLQHTIDSLEGWQKENHGFTRVIDARITRRRKP